MILSSIAKTVVPLWVKIAAVAALAASLIGFGFVKGMEHVYKNQAKEVPKIVYVQGKVTTKVVTKYVKQAQTIQKQGEELKKEGQSYAIKFPSDDYIFNNYYVWLYDGSLTGSVPPLSSGESANPSGITVSEALAVSIVNNTAARMWKNRALACEEWTQKQEEEGLK